MDMMNLESTPYDELAANEILRGHHQEDIATLRARVVEALRHAYRYGHKIGRRDGLREAAAMKPIKAAKPAKLHQADLFDAKGRPNENL